MLTEEEEEEEEEGLLYCGVHPFILQAYSYFDFTEISSSSYVAYLSEIVLLSFIFLNNNTLVEHFICGRYVNTLLLSVKIVIDLKAKKLSRAVTRMT
jgi:hypothetical protein